MHKAKHFSLEILECTVVLAKNTARYGGKVILQQTSLDLYKDSNFPSNMETDFLFWETPWQTRTLSWARTSSLILTQMVYRLKAVWHLFPWFLLCCCRNFRLQMPPKNRSEIPLMQKTYFFWKEKCKQKISIIWDKDKVGNLRIVFFRQSCVLTAMLFLLLSHLE